MLECVLIMNGQGRGGEMKTGFSKSINSGVVSMDIFFLVNLHNSIEFHAPRFVLFFIPRIRVREIEQAKKPSTISTNKISSS